MTDKTLPTLDQMTDILDIEGIIGFPWEKIVFWAVALLLLLLASFLAYQWWRRRGKGGGRHNRILSPEEKFFEEMARLADQQFLEKGEMRKFYFFLSEIFRQYLTERYGFPAIDKTTPEIEAGMSEVQAIAAVQKKTLLDFLVRADLVKFAKMDVTSRDAENDRDLLAGFVRQGVPVEEKAVS